MRNSGPQMKTTANGGSVRRLSGFFAQRLETQRWRPCQRCRSWARTTRSSREFTTAKRKAPLLANDAVAYGYPSGSRNASAIAHARTLDGIEALWLGVSDASLDARKMWI